MPVSKGMVWTGLFIGSTIGSFLPELWGAGIFSYASVFGSAIGGLIGIWAGVKMSYWF